MRVVILFFVFILAAEAEEPLIYQPILLSPEFDYEEDEQANWMLGLSLGRHLPEYLHSGPRTAILANYLIWNRWYVNAEIWQSDWYALETEVLRATGGSIGVGFHLLEGAAYVSQGTVLPWVLYTQANAGQQSLKNRPGAYVSGALGWQVSMDEYYGGLEFRRFGVDSDMLRLPDRGYQWSVIVGKYF